MSEFIGLIPEGLIDPDRKKDFLMWLISLDVDVWTKKYLYLAWCELLGVVATKEDVDLITGDASITWG